MKLENITVAQALLLLGGAGAVFEMIRRAWPWARDFVRFMIEVVGAPERNGLPARPGLVQAVRDLTDQVSRVEAAAATAATAAAAADTKVDHVSAQVAEVRALAEDVRDQQQALAGEQSQIRQAIEEIRQSGTDAPDTKEQQ